VINVAVVEDSAAVRDVWRQMLASIGGIGVVAEFSGAALAIDRLAQYPHDVVLLDIGLAEGNGMDVLRVLARACPKTKVIVVTNYSEPIYRQQYLAAGAFAFFDKNRELRELRRTLQALVENPTHALSEERIDDANRLVGRDHRALFKPMPA
jgi:DNA-binding NarL/FixJ family response regulator